MALRVAVVCCAVCGHIDIKKYCGVFVCAPPSARPSVRAALLACVGVGGRAVRWVGASCERACEKEKRRKCGTS